MRKKLTEEHGTRTHNLGLYTGEMIKYQMYQLRRATRYHCANPPGDKPDIGLEICVKFRHRFGSNFRPNCTS